MTARTWRAAACWRTTWAWARRCRRSPSWPASAWCSPRLATWCSCPRWGRSAALPCSAAALLRCMPCYARPLALEQAINAMEREPDGWHLLLVCQLPCGGLDLLIAGGPTDAQVVLFNWVAEFEKWLPRLPPGAPGLSVRKASAARACVPAQLPSRRKGWRGVGGGHALQGCTSAC